MKNFLIKVARKIGLIQDIGVISYLRYLMAPRGQRVKVTIRGKSIVVRRGTPDLGVAESCLSGEFEIVRFLLPENYAGVIVDAGGYIGTASIALREIFPKAKLIVIEPSSDNFEVLKLNLADVRNIQLVYGALIGTSEKTVQLNNRGTGNWGFTVVATPQDKPDALPIQETRAFRLQDLVSDQENIGLLKLDIEGGELSLLENDVQTLKNIDVVFAELHERIVPGCVKRFFDFSEDRILLRDKGEKYLSIKR